MILDSDSLVVKKILLLISFVIGSVSDPDPVPDPFGSETLVISRLTILKLFMFLRLKCKQYFPLRQGLLRQNRNRIGDALLSLLKMKDNQLFISCGNDIFCVRVISTVN